MSSNNIKKNIMNNTCLNPFDSNTSSIVKIYRINDNKPKRLIHLKADEGDYWRNFTMIGYSSYYKDSNDLKILAVKFSDTCNMIETNNLQLKDIVHLLRKLGIIFSNNMLDEIYLTSDYFYFSQESVYTSTKSKNENFENLYVTFRGLRLISDLINKGDSKENLMDLIDANDRKYTSVKSAYYESCNII